MVDMSAAYAIPHLTLDQEESDVQKAARVEKAQADVKEYVENIVRGHIPEGKTVWCQKSVATLDDAELVSLVFPDAKYVCLYRNCLDFVHSAMGRSRNGWRRYGFERAMLSEVIHNEHESSFPDALCRFWFDRVEKLMRFENANPALCHRVKFEELVFYARDTCGRLLTFLGLEPFTADSEKALWDRVFVEAHQRGRYLGDPRADKSRDLDRSRIGAGSGADLNYRKHIGEATWARLQTLQKQLGYSPSSPRRFYRGGFEDKGKGTPEGDGKDAEMRRVADKAIVELDDSNRPSSSRTTQVELGMFNGESDVIVMLARNGSLKGKDLRPETAVLVEQAWNRNCAFVVGDMLGVDTAFMDLLDKIGAVYTIYYCGDCCRVWDYLECH